MILHFTYLEPVGWDMTQIYAYFLAQISEFMYNKIIFISFQLIYHFHRKTKLTL